MNTVWDISEICIWLLYGGGLSLENNKQMNKVPAKDPTWGSLSSNEGASQVHGDK